MTNDFWAIKIAALLHDPPGKVLMLGVKSHEKYAFEVIEHIIGTPLFKQVFGFENLASLNKEEFKKCFENSANAAIIKKADAVASAIDRTAFPKPLLGFLSSSYRPQALIRHPLSGSPITLPTISCLSDEAAVYKVKDQLDAVEKLVRGEPDLRRAYLRLWRSLPEIARDAETRLLPADTRIVDHTLWQHLDATAALTTALPHPCLLVFSVGPVQSFIAEARRTQDLWMGSYLLSYLTWSAICAVIENAGPDAILYPALRGQPLVDHWLWTQSLLPEKPDLNDLAVATIPNKFVALLPTDQAESLAKQATEAVQKTWRGIAEHVREKFPGGIPGSAWDQIWTRQVDAEDWPEIYWSVLPWPDTSIYSKTTDEAEAALKLDEKYLSDPSPFRATFEVYRAAWPKGINSGTVYGRLHALANRGFEFRKRSRNFYQVQENGEKCTVSGARSALCPNETCTRMDLRYYWQSVAEVLRNQERYHEVKPDGSERLSAIVAIKRFAQWDYFEQELGLMGGFPSTSRVSAAPFYVALLEKLETNSELLQAVKDHLSNLADLNFPPISKTAARLSLPYLAKRVQSELASQLLAYDADILFKETFSLSRLKKDCGISATQEQADQAAASCRKLMDAAGKAELATPKPPRYYAVLMLDGDYMGHWLSGDKELMPKLQESFHPDVIKLFTADVLEKDKWLVPRLQNEGKDITVHEAEWKQILNSARPLSVALHNSISAALTNFALRCVRQIVEQRYPGRVVYAGGDDLLALLPAQYALAAARELRALFSGESRIAANGDIWEVEPMFRDPNCTGYLQIENEWLLTMGPRSTASIGIAIAHHMQPLDSVLEAAREAIRAAKENFGRNAISVYFLRRSGERMMIGSKWFYAGHINDPLATMERMRQRFANGRLARGFAFSLSKEAQTLAALPKEAQRAELSRLLRRHEDENLMIREEVEELAGHLVEWATALHSHWSVKGADKESSAAGIVELSHWMLLARFLSQVGEE